MLGLPASVKAPALAATDGCVVAQLLSPWVWVNQQWILSESSIKARAGLFQQMVASLFLRPGEEINTFNADDNLLQYFCNTFAMLLHNHH